MSESEQKKRAIYAERSRLKRQEHLLARSPEASDPIVPYLFSQTFAGTEYLCPKLETEFYKLHGFLNRYLKLTQDGKDCRSPCAEEGGFQVVAKVNIAFDTILCYVVGKVYIIEIGEDVPASHAPHYVFGTLRTTYLGHSTLIQLTAPMTLAIGLSIVRTRTIPKDLN